jgi:hypothetical protein
VAVVPREFHRHHGFVFAVLIGEPLRLSDFPFRVGPPEIDALNGEVGEPDRKVMVVVRRAGVAHPRHRQARGGADERVKERPGVLRAEVPAEPLPAPDEELGLMVGQGEDRARHGRVAFGRGAGGGPRP